MLEIIALSFSILLCAATVKAQDDWHTYPFRDLRSLIGGESELLQNAGNEKKVDMVISAKPFPSKTRVTFTGKKRALSHYGKMFVRLWADSRNTPEGAVDQLVDEFLFLEQDKEYWLIVQKNTAEAISKSLQAGDEVVIYYFYLGGYDPHSLYTKSDLDNKPEPESDDMRWILAVERVQRPGTGFPMQRVDEILLGGEGLATFEDNGFWIDPRNVKAKLKAQFLGDVREISGKRKELIHAWFEKIGTSNAALLMRTEGLFSVGGKQYWIVLREQTREHLQTYVKKGDTLFLNTIVAGKAENTGRNEWVLMTGEYTTF